jgi:hypothetical protein
MTTYTLSVEKASRKWYFGEARHLTYLAELAEPPPGDPLRTSLLLPRLLVRITLLLSLARIAADASPAPTNPKDPPKPSVEGFRQGIGK